MKLGRKRGGENFGGVGKRKEYDQNTWYENFFKHSFVCLYVCLYEYTYANLQIPLGARKGYRMS